MAFIRQYADSSGDPFRKRFGRFLKRATKPPKAVRAIQKQITWKSVGRGLKRIAPAALAIAAPQFLPAFAALGAIGGRGGAPAPSDPPVDDRPMYGGAYSSPSYGMEVTAPRYEQPEPDEEEEDVRDDEDDYQGDPDELMDHFLRGYTGMAGDPRKRAPKSTNTLARAGTSPKQKANAKRANTAKARAHAAGAATAAAKKGKTRKGTGPKIDFTKLAQAGLAGIPVAGGIASELFGQVAGGAGGGAARGPRGFGGHRRTINPANVKALRRSLRRVEGFEKLVKRVEKMYPRMRRHATHAAPHHKGKR